MKKTSKDLQIAIDIATEAGELILKEAEKIRRSKYANASFVRHKNIKNLSKNEIVTTVDRTVDKFVIRNIQKHFPKDFIIAEESPATTKYGLRKNKRRVWLVDPIDGTHHFVNYLLGRRLRPIDKTFAVSIGLAVDGQAQLGVIYTPLRNELIYAEKGQSAYLQVGNAKPIKLKVRTAKKTLSNLNLALTGKNLPRMHLFKKMLHGQSMTRIGPLAHRLVQVTGAHDVVMTTRPSGKEWDVISADVIVHEAGGVLLDADGQRFQYNKPDVKNYPIYFSSNKALAPLILKQIQRYRLNAPSITLIGAISHSTPVYENGEIRERWGGSVMYGGFTAGKMKLPTRVITAGAPDIIPGMRQLEQVGVKVHRIARPNSNNFANDYSKPKRVLRMRSIMKKPILAGDLKKLQINSDVIILNPIYHEITPELCKSLGDATIMMDVQGLTRETQKQADGFYHLIKHRWNKLSDYRGMIEVLKMSDEDLEHIHIPANYKTIPQKLNYLANHGFPIVVLTQGSKGTLVARQKEGIIEVPVHKVKAVDTGGAGDSFNIGFAYGYLKHHDPVEGAAYGNAVASFFVSAKGTAGLKSLEVMTKRAQTILRKVK